MGNASQEYFLKQVETHEKKRHECEVIYVASMPVDDIQPFLDLVRKKRGDQNYFKLRDDVADQWRFQQKIRNMSFRIRAE